MLVYLVNGINYKERLYILWYSFIQNFVHKCHPLIYMGESGLSHVIQYVSHLEDDIEKGVGKMSQGACFYSTIWYILK